MSVEATFNKTVDIIRPVDNKDETTGTDYIFDQESNKTTVISNYRCRISESISYSVGKEGSQYQGTVKMIGTLTDEIQEGDIVADKYKVVGEPSLRYKQRCTICNMVRL